VLKAAPFDNFCFEKLMNQPSIPSIVTAAKQAFDLSLLQPTSVRSALLRALAVALQANDVQLIECAHEETSLPLARLTGEVSRTCFQLLAFADYIDQGLHLRALHEPAVQGPPPAGRPRLEITTVPVGPVAVFSASNFPFAFSVLGGDTASALAAGCPVIVKAHPAHLRLSAMVFELAQKVLAQQTLPKAWISMIASADIQSGVDLVVHPEIAAVSFTGSLHAGKALAKHISGRDKPIAFFGELGSINPVLVLPHFLNKQGSESAYALADAMVQGAGQFCTSPGLILLPSDSKANDFINALAKRLDEHTTHPMLTPGIRRNFERATAQTLSIEGVHQLTKPSIQKVDDDAGPKPTLVEVSLDTFSANPLLHEEVFGPFAVVVKLPDSSDAAYKRALKHIEGSLTVTLWADQQDQALLKAILPEAMQRAGRVLFGGVPTGVAVSQAQHHGGPWPASTRPDSTSVGMRAMERFLRPVVLQDQPEWL
jgi:acyl-CoA reductase-like NAD-dependent aldehyde dehydrogenase